MNEGGERRSETPERGVRPPPALCGFIFWVCFFFLFLSFFFSFFFPSFFLFAIQYTRSPLAAPPPAVATPAAHGASRAASRAPAAPRSHRRAHRDSECNAFITSSSQIYKALQCVGLLSVFFITTLCTESRPRAPAVPFPLVRRAPAPLFVRR